MLGIASPFMHLLRKQTIPSMQAARWSLQGIRKDVQASCWSLVRSLKQKE